MNEKFQNKYRIKSHRHPTWDYSSDGLYFITFVTQNHECNLGEVLLNGEDACVELSDFGNIVEQEWLKSFQIRKELFLDEYIIMPNNLHAIVAIDRNRVAYRGFNDGDMQPPNSITVETHGRASNNHQVIRTSKKQTTFKRLSKSLSSFVAGYKTAVNSCIDNYIDEHNLCIPKYNRNNHFFQSNYHDHIIREGISYENIKNYIRSNPNTWIEDSLNPENMGD